MKQTLTILFLFLVTIGKAQTAYTLDQCLQMARENNRTIQNYALELQGAGEQKKEAFTKYFPQISANVTAFYAFNKILKGDVTIPQELAALGQPFASFAGIPADFGVLDRGYGAVISAVEPIYAGGQIHNGNKLAAVGMEAARLKLSIKEKDILQSVTENFWQVATIKYNLRTIAAAEKQIAAVKQHVQNCLDAGVTTRNAMLQVKLREQELASNRLKLENGEHILLMLLAQQIGKAPQTPCEGGSSNGTGINNDFDISVPEEATPSSMPSPMDVLTAINNRDELHLKTKAVEAQQLKVKMERGKNLPTLAVGAMGFHADMGGKYLNMAGQAVDIGGSGSIMRMTNGLGLATLAIPISSWWGGSHAIRRQKFLLKEAENNLADAREMLAIDIESAWSNVQEAYKQIEIAKASVSESEENLRMYTDQYKAGTVTITDLLDAETLNRKSHDQLSSAIATYNIKLSDYKRKTE